MKLTFRHRFTDGRRAVMTMRGANGHPRVQWPDGMPPAGPALVEYHRWMLESLQEAANRYRSQILYVLPTEDGVAMATLTPANP